MNEKGKVVVLYLMVPDSFRDYYNCGLFEVVITRFLKLSFQRCSDDSGLDEVDFISTCLKVSFWACNDLICVPISALE
jgi:hypothetical protein